MEFIRIRAQSRICLLALVALLLLPACRGTTLPGSNTAKSNVAHDESPAPDRFTVVRLASADGDLRELLKAEAQKARQLGRFPFVEFYADWCPPCNALSKNLGDARMVDAFSGTYIIRLNLDEWNTRLAGTGFQVIGIPVFFELDQDGKPTGRNITGGAWGEDSPENMAPLLKAFFGRHWSDTES
jgi:thiol:disulfide interchange protein